MKAKLTRLMHCLAPLMVLFAVATQETPSADINTAAKNKKNTATSYNRIVSLAPSNTEMLFAVGGGERLIGISTACDYPAAAKTKTIVGSFLSIQPEKLAQLNPDLVLLVNGQEALSAQIRKQSIQTRILPNSHLSDISTNLRLLGQLSGQSLASEKVAKHFEAKLKELQSIIGQAKTRPSLFLCIWPEPLLTIGHDGFINEAITICGGTNIAGKLPGSYPRINSEKLVLANPDVVVLPFQVQGQTFIRKAPWSSLTALKVHRLFYLPPPEDDHLCRPTNRILFGLYWLALRLHPELKTALDRWQQGCKEIRADENLILEKN